jgi:UDP-N-acetylenolpyruvoylglucosamine reductase
MTKLDNWDYKDLLFLIDLAKKKVFEKFGIELLEEVRIIRNESE